MKRITVIEEYKLMMLRERIKGWQKRHQAVQDKIKNRMKELRKRIKTNNHKFKEDTTDMMLKERINNEAYREELRFLSEIIER